MLHHLFLHAINQQLAFFAEAWNQHKLQIRDGPNRSPADLFGFDMMVHGVRGNQLPMEELSDEELEVYGVDWEGLRDERLLQSQRSNNSNGEGWTSWISRSGPPEHLNEVPVFPPSSEALTSDEILALNTYLQPISQTPDNDGIIILWVHAIAYVRTLRNSLF